MDKAIEDNRPVSSECTRRLKRESHTFTEYFGSDQADTCHLGSQCRAPEQNDDNPLPHVEYRVFPAVCDRRRAAAQVDLISALCRGPEGANLLKPNLADWITKGVICCAAEDIARSRVLSGGCIIPGNRHAKLVAVGTLPEARGRGYANGVIERLITVCRTQGFVEITLDIRLTNAGLPKPAYHLYRSHGFVLEPGVNAIPIGWAEESRHLWLHDPDPGGVFRARAMTLHLTNTMPTEKHLQRRFRNAA